MYVGNTCITHVQCVYKYICTYMYVHVYIYTYVCVYCMYIYVHMNFITLQWHWTLHLWRRKWYIYIPTGAPPAKTSAPLPCNKFYVHVYTWITPYMYIRTYIYIYVCMYYVHTCVHIYEHIQTLLTIESTSFWTGEELGAITAITFSSGMGAAISRSFVATVYIYT